MSLTTIAGAATGPIVNVAEWINEGTPISIHISNHTAKGQAWIGVKEMKTEAAKLGFLGTIDVGVMPPVFVGGEKEGTGVLSASKLFEAKLSLLIEGGELTGQGSYFAAELVYTWEKSKKGTLKIKDGRGNPQEGITLPLGEGLDLPLFHATQFRVTETLAMRLLPGGATLQIALVPTAR